MRSSEILAELTSDGGAPKVGKYSRGGASELLSYVFDKDKILEKRLPYERLDQLTVDLLFGVR
jgi:xylose isomerase